MKKLILPILCALLAATAVTAETKVYGPVKNYKGMQDVTVGIVIPTTCATGIYNPFTGEFHQIRAFGGQEFKVTHASPVFVDSYIYIQTPPGIPFDPDTDDITLTEIFAYDLEPGLDPNEVPLQRGFNPMSLELIPTQPEGYLIGISGTSYNVPLETIPVMDLSLRLPGYNVSKIIDETPGSLVHLLQAQVPAADFIEKPFEFTYEYQGYITQENPDWRGPKNPEYPFQHFWELDIQHWADVEYVSDVDIEEPWVIYPGYIEVVPPDDWVSSGVKKGRYGYESNPGAEIGAGGGSLGIEWRVNGKIPAVVPGHVVLTMSKIPISKYMNTMIVDSEEERCGDWGYLEADIDEDCDVDFGDVALLALDWLKCTDPQGAECFYETIIAVGFAFDGEDYQGPATIAFLYEGSTAQGILEPNDIIVEYRGYNVTGGAQLLGIIQALPDLNAGDLVPMTVIKEATGTSVNVEPVAMDIPVVSGRSSSTGKKCVELKITPSNKRSCMCASGTKICACGWEAKRDKSGKIMEIRRHCSDTGGNVCHGDWLTVK